MSDGVRASGSNLMTSFVLALLARCLLEIARLILEAKGRYPKILVISSAGRSSNFVSGPEKCRNNDLLKRTSSTELGTG